jgi:dTDP-4-dehydrorhamnose 3,5-epimerase
MKVLTCDIPGLLTLEPKVFGDARGFFLETWNRRRYGEAGVDVDFVQDNLSFSRRGTLRGLHFQNPNAWTSGATRAPSGSGTAWS